ncbi:hypothetical protein V9T40_003112 [Parthenolecanium corni]|uniref:Spaetzle domain-containing protein n=1 Tax=Parthenolecanium corni TaxID=536013 RepID=A0AAN9U2A4_9HEMI
MYADIFIILWLPIGFIQVVRCYDEYTSCSKPFRTSKSLSDLPCDFQNENWCVLPGNSYPWHAVRKFVYDNHGLMKRMYGEERHFKVLRAEFDTNDVETGKERWHRYSEGAYKRQEKSSPTILRQTFSFPSSSPTSVSSTTTTSTTTPTTTTVSTTTARPTTADNSTIFDLPYSTEDTEDEEEDVTSTEAIYDTTVSEELPISTSTTTTSPPTSSAELAKTSSPQIFQETTSEMPILRLKGINACPVKEEVVAPFWANNTRGEILALLNLYPFEQYVHWERCTYEHKQMYCRQGCRCEQQYRLHRLLAYDPRNDCRGIFSDWFKFPSCCVCKCYDIATEFRQTSRSPRNKENKSFPPYFPWND